MNIQHIRLRWAIGSLDVGKVGVLGGRRGRGRVSRPGFEDERKNNEPDEWRDCGAGAGGGARGVEAVPGAQPGLHEPFRE